jgi:hypothetical protein
MPAATYRQATRVDLDIAVEWEGEVIATGSVVSYGGDFGFMGFFIVPPDLRGQGVGREFWYWRRDLLIDRLKPNTRIGLDALALANRHGMTEVFGCARMYYGPAPVLPWDDIYGVTTFELG